MRQEDEKQTEFKLAELPECCQEKLTEFERELNSMGYWNIALVAYQKESAPDGGGILQKVKIFTINSYFLYCLWNRNNGIIIINFCEIYQGGAEYRAYLKNRRRERSNTNGRI